MSDEKRTESLLVDDLRKRIDEIDKSNQFNAQANANYIVPRRRDGNVEEVVKKPVVKEKKTIVENRYSSLENYNEAPENIYRPRKKVPSAFTDEQQKMISESVELIRNEHDAKERFIKKEEKRLLKDQNKIIKKINKYDRKINLYQQKENYDEAQKTMELKERLTSELKEIQQNFKEITMSFSPGMSLDERRRKIYNNAYNAETNRVRKMINARQKAEKGNGLNWESHVEYSDMVQPDKNAGTPERKRERSWEEELEAFGDDKF